MNIIGGKLDGEYIYDNGYTLRYRKLNDDEIKFLFHNIQLNTSFSLPERLVQDFVQDGSIIPTFKKCIHFNKEDLNEMIRPLKRQGQKRKNLPKKKTRKNKNDKNEKKNNEKKNNEKKNNEKNEKNKKKRQE
jgi:hypothetical protein